MRAWVHTKVDRWAHGPPRPEVNTMIDDALVFALLVFVCASIVASDVRKFMASWRATRRGGR